MCSGRLSMRPQCDSPSNAGANPNLVAITLTHELFIRERAIDLRGVEKRDAAFDRRPNQGDHLLLVCRRTVAKAHSHAAEADRRDFEIAPSERSLLHCLSS